MGKQNVLEMLRKPIQRSASSLSGLEHAAELISEFHRLLAEKDATIQSMQQTIDLLTRQAASSREKPPMPEIHFEITGRDPSGRIQLLKAVPQK